MPDPSSTPEVTNLLDRIRDIAAGDYSGDLMVLTRDGTPEPVRSIAEAMGLMVVRVEAREYQLELLVEDLRRLNERIRRDSLQAVSAMAQALEARDAYTRGHADRVAGLASRIARELGLDDAAVETIRTAGILHDIGKIGCSDRIFEPHEARNPPDVVREILSHPGAGVEILKHLDFLGEVIDLVHGHHERVDGKGYPRGLRGDGIPLGARILAVADAYDAMTTERPYQKAMDHDTALGIFRKMAGTKWDAACVAAFERLGPPVPSLEVAP